MKKSALLLSLVLTTLPALASNKAEKRFHDDIAARLRKSHEILLATHAKFGSWLIYTMSEDAYRAATADFEDYEGGLPVSHERLENDAQEVWMDLYPIRAAIELKTLAPVMTENIDEQ
jgi:hypothetical protein